MKSIKEHFNHWIPAKNMILIDNNEANLKEVSTGSDGATPSFQIVSAGCLEKNTGSSIQDKKFRTRQCFNVLKNCKQLIIRRIQEVLCEEAELKKTQPIVHTAPPVLPPPPSRFRHGLSFQQTAVSALQTFAQLKLTEEVAENPDEGNSNNSVP